MDTQKLIDIQLKRKEELRDLTLPLKHITRTAVKARIEQLEALLKEFKKTHDEIQEFGKPDIPYLINKSGDATIALINLTIDELRQLKVSEEKVITPRIIAPKVINPSKPDENPGITATADQNRIQQMRVRKLEFKVDKLRYAIDSIKCELSSPMSWTKELFQFKHKFLTEQWSVIALLEEEIVMEDVDNTFMLDNQPCQTIFNEMNDVIKQISEKIHGNLDAAGVSTNIVRGSRLPDLKVPVFNGDYKKWQNFKDVFETLIHNREELTIVQKMEYLKTYLDGEPLRLISAFTLSADNYEDAYKTLLKRYDHKRKLLTIHLDNMSKPIGKQATAENVKELHDSISEGMTAIKNLGIDNSTWGPVIVHLAVACLDTESRSLFEIKNNDNAKDIPTLEDFLKFLEGRYKTLEIMDPIKGNVNNPQQSPSYKSKGNYAGEKRSDSKQLNCPKCDGEHRLFMCPKFLSLSTKSRYKFVKTVGICINCLQKHAGKCESKKNCKQCEKHHNSLLHFEREQPSKKQANFGNKVIDVSKEEVMATALLMVRDLFGNPLTARVLVDTGAQGNFITEGLVQKLRLPKLPYDTEIIGIGKVNAHRVRHAVEINVEPSFPSEFNISLKALVMGKEVTSTTPEATITEKLPIGWPSLNLADKSFRTPGAIDMVLGISFFSKILLPEIYRSENSDLIALNSRVGWLILGETRRSGSYTSIKSMISMKEEVDQISKFWELEDVPPTRFLSPEDKICEDSFSMYHQRLEDGRYSVNIPFKTDVESLPDLRSSRKRAMTRFLSLEKKFEMNQEYAEDYKTFMSEYISLGHMQKVEVDNSINCYYMPHHAVIKPESTTTKVRVVFDASSKTDNVSLNQLMLAGPRLQDDLASVILRWRMHQYVISADVEKMYRQIVIAPEHQRFQRVLWRSNPSEQISTYEMTTVTYGTTSAPYLAIKTLQQLANDEVERFPKAAQVALHDFYVDDVLTGEETLEACQKLQEDLQKLLRTGGFSLRKWASNSNQILKNIDPDDICKEICFQDHEDQTIKTLGITWSPKEDQFRFKISPLDFNSIKKTKRMLSSDVSKIFDPLGWLSPVSIKAKILFQRTWKAGIGWNDVLPEDICSDWIRFRDDLGDIKYINIPRWTNTTSESNIELHGFCDASQVAYAATLYVKTTSCTGNVSVNLLMSKTKVAPIKQEITIARMELCGALLLSRLYAYAVKSLHFEKKPFYAWCDSTIALSWIKGDPSKWKMFVANRVDEIQKATQGCNWRYVSTADNPADCASRGISANQLRHHNLWWNGPAWLLQTEEKWPTCQAMLNIDVPEMKVQHKIAATVKHKVDNIENIISRFSSAKKLRAAIAFCLRFIHNCRNANKVTGDLKMSEIVHSENTIIRQLQLVYYQDEIGDLTNNRRLNNKNGILSLTPMLDDVGILRVTGRLQNALISYNEKHPIILPRQAHFSRLIAREAHERCHHGLNNLTEYVIKRMYWIIKCKDLVKNIIHHCVKCRRRSPKLGSQLMGDLPLARITLNNPFYYSGLDYAGPFNIKAWKGRCNKTFKSYICVFVCMTTKALHLELASDLTSEAFIAAYRRFSYRRGPCRHLFSDCGTNFVGANKILQKDLIEFQKSWACKIKSTFDEGITWHFNPPASPHAGGLWEAGVKSVKHLLLKYLGNSTLTYEEFSTLLVQIEGCLNSRPLGVQRNVPEDQAVLTPNHFLNGTTIFSNPEPENGTVPLALRWRYVQQLKSQICKEFKIQLLHNLQHRRKWNQPSENTNISDVVIVEDSALPSYKWPIGIVTQTHPGKDGLVRVVTVKMESGRMLQRPVTKIGKLPILENDLSCEKGLDQANSTTNNHPTAEVKQSGHRYKLRKRTVQFSRAAVWSTLLFTLVCSSLATNPQKFVPATVQQFDHKSGLFFAKIGSLKASTSLWTMIMYYNMSSFFTELEGLETSAKLLAQKCGKHNSISTYCYATSTDIMQQLDEINEDNEVLMDLNHSVDPLMLNDRIRRAVTSLLPFVGSLSRAAFGTLDEEYARKLEGVISTMKDDDQHLLNLVKNQTSIMETFLQQARLTEDRSNQQFQWIKSNLDSLDNVIDEVNKNTLMTSLQFIAAHLTARAQHLFSIQSAIIQSITNAHHGNLRAILHPAIFKKQLKLMKTTLPAETDIPVTSNNLIQLYSLMSVKTRISEHMIIFHFSMPLVSTKRYELYKTIPLPIRIEEHVAILQPTTEYFAISLHRDKFLEISAAELALCAHLDENTSLCQEHHPEFKNVPESNSCEMNFFIHQRVNTSLCKTILMSPEQLWIQLPSPNKWVFYTKDIQGYNVICGKEVYNIKLEREGIISLEPTCTLEHKTFTIPRSDVKISEIEDELYLPEMNITIPDESYSELVNLNKSTLVIKRTDNFQSIQQNLVSIKQQQYLKTQQLTHQLSVSSLSIAAGLAAIICAYVMWKLFQKRKSKPKPYPRKIYNSQIIAPIEMRQLGIDEVEAHQHHEPEEEEEQQQQECQQQRNTNPVHPLDNIHY